MGRVLAKGVSYLQFGPFAKFDIEEISWTAKNSRLCVTDFSSSEKNPQNPKTLRQSSKGKKKLITSIEFRILSSLLFVKCV